MRVESGGDEPSSQLLDHWGRVAADLRLSVTDLPSRGRRQLDSPPGFINSRRDRATNPGGAVSRNS